MKYQDFQNLFKSKLKMTFFVLLILVSLTFAADPADYGSWQLLTFLALVISSVLITVAYIFGNVASIQIIQIAAKSEIKEIIMTVILVGMFVIFIGLIENVMIDGEDLQTEAMGRTGHDIAQLNIVLENLFGSSNVVGKTASTSASCYFKSTGFSLSGCAGLSPVSTLINTMSNTIFIGLLDLSAQAIIIQSGEFWMLHVMLPLGVFFRCFAFTRKIGGALIAIGIGFGIVFPLSIILIDNILHEPFGYNDDIPDDVSSGFHAISNSAESCDPYEFDYTSINGTMQETLGLGGLVVKYVMMISILSTAISLLLVLGLISVSAGALGSPINISMLERFR